MGKVWTLTEDAARVIAADHRKLNAKVENLRRLAEATKRFTPSPKGVHFHNDSGESIPAYAVMRIVDVSSTYAIPYRVLNVEKPDTTFCTHYLVNGPMACQDNGNGLGSYLTDESAFVLTDSTYTPTAGQEWGPISGSWALVRHRQGFLIDGGATGSGATYRAVAKQRVVCDLLGKPTGDMTKGTASAVTIWMPKASATVPFSAADYEDSGYDDVTALPLGSDVAGSLFCSLQFSASQWLAGCLEQ